MESTQYVDKNTEKPLSKENPIQIKGWDEFRKTGLFLIVNQLLHVFGWCLILHTDKDNSVEYVMPARTIFKGYVEEHQDEDYKKVTKYLADNAEQLLKESEL